MACIALDGYYKGLNEGDRHNVANYNWDHPTAIDLDHAYETLLKLMNGEDAEVPEYDFTVHSRKEHPVLIKAQPIIVFEGIFALHDERIRKLMDFKIFILTDDETRLSRRIIR